MEPKKLAMILGIAVLLPLFFGLFMDALYDEPTYEMYCNESMYSTPYADKFAEPARQEVNCTYKYGPEQQQCDRSGGISRMKYDSNNCGSYDWCDYCNKNYDAARSIYNRNLFLILAPLGLIVVILGIYLMVDYLGAGLMMGGLITMFYATVRYFSDMSKMLRALVILVELLIIMWIGYKKIDDGKKASGSKGKRAKPKQ
ncbi:MAG: hypothetical protein V1866_06140 [archaeon]